MTWSLAVSPSILCWTSEFWKIHCLWVRDNNDLIIPTPHFLIDLWGDHCWRSGSITSQPEYGDALLNNAIPPKSIMWLSHSNVLWVHDNNATLQRTWSLCKEVDFNYLDKGDGGICFFKVGNNFCNRFFKKCNPAMVLAMGHVLRCFICYPTVGTDVVYACIPQGLFAIWSTPPWDLLCNKYSRLLGVAVHCQFDTISLDAIEFRGWDNTFPVKKFPCILSSPVFFNGRFDWARDLCAVEEYTKIFFWKNNIKIIIRSVCAY